MSSPPVGPPPPEGGWTHPGRSVRRAARVVVVDGLHRVLLLGYRNPSTGVEFWATPGGGMDPGEEPVQAARREFREETGHEAPADLGPIVWRRVVGFEWAGGWVDQEEVYFFTRVDELRIADAHVAALASEGVIGHRWQTLDEIRNRHGFEVAPRRLADLVADLLVAGPPDRPIELGL